MYSSNVAALILVSFILHGHTAPTSRKLDPTTTPEQTDGENKVLAVKQDSTPRTKSHRQNKALNIFSFLSPFISTGLDFSEDDEDDVTFGVSDDGIDDNELSRTIPSRPQNKNNGGYNRLPNDNNNINSLHYDNSPIFYVRLPPTPYMFVPGLGYVSHPPSLGPPMPPPVADPFINLPLDFISNGKPTGIYQWNVPPGYSDPQITMFGYGPQPVMPMNQPTYNDMSFNNVKPTQSNSKVTNLKGQYVFNGKPPAEVNVLRDTYNSIYTDALQNFYP